MWQDLSAWFQSPGGARVLQTAIIPALTIVVAAVVAALIARSAVKAMARRSDRTEAASAVGALVAAARLAGGQDRDHAQRLLAEADVRTRLLPLPGADLAADWAGSRIVALQGRSAGTSADNEIEDLRDRLVSWVERPARAKRQFAGTAPKPATAQTAEKTAEKAAEPAATTPTIADVAPVAPAAAVPPAEAPGKDRFARPEPGPRRTPAPEEPAPADDSVPEPDQDVTVAPAAVVQSIAVPTATTPPASGEAVPAWQRTRAGERLQQERFRTRAVEPPILDEEELVPASTAPVQMAHAHRAAGAPSSDADEAVRLEAHQQARHARPGEQTANGAAAVAPAAPATAAPAWLDQYDDEAQVTQNLDLKTPPPVAASAIRDRGGSGEDLVPRS